MGIKTHYEELKISPTEYFSVRYARRNNIEPWLIENHYSNSLEIIVYNHITATLHMEMNQVDLQDQSLLILPPYTVHGFEVDKGQHDYFIIHILLDALPEQLRDLTLPTTPHYFDIKQDDSSLIYELLSLCSRQKTSPKIKEQTLILFFYWLCDQTPLQSQISVSNPSNTSRFIQLLKHLDEHTIYSMSADKAAELCNISKSHFFALFKEHFGKTFAEFMVTRQVTQAKYLLSTTDMSITEIALQLSFCDASYFTKVFKSIIGLTPRAFRQQH